MRAIGGLLTATIMIVAAGCGGADSGVAVEGKVVKDGAPVKMEEGEVVTITLKSQDGTTFTTTATPEGSFSVQKPAGGPIPAGKYTVTYVHQLAPSPYTKKPGFKHAGEVPGGWDVSSSNSTFTIDIGKKK